MKPTATLLTGALLLLLPDAVAAGDRPGSKYFLLLFGGQGDVRKPTTAHVWATYVKVNADPGGQTDFDICTISWLPATGRVRVLACWPEPGRNFSLDETLEHLRGPRQRIALWGPYEISECRYHQACCRRAELETGKVMYKLIDGFNRRATVEHCLHGVTAAHPDVHERCRIVLRYGEGGAALVAHAMRATGMIRHLDGTHDWLLSILGLECQRFVRRKPGDGLLWRR